MSRTVYSGLESRSHGAQNPVQCLWGSLDEAQQAQMINTECSSGTQAQMINIECSKAT